MAGLFVVDSLQKSATRDARHVTRLTDVEIDELEGRGLLRDRYAGSSWSAASLQALIASLEERATVLRCEVEAALLLDLRKQTYEEWMSPMLEERLAKSERHRSAQRILALARRALDENAILVFEGD